MTPPAADRTDRTGRLVNGRFKITEQIGMGGMGVVYEAEDVVLGRAVAVKLLRADSDELSARLEREARAAARISARHVATIHDVGNDPDLGLYMVMERLRGETLEERYHREGRLPIDETAHIGIQIAEALGAAHQAGVVHRDLKPGNVFLLADGSVKVMDFGIAKIVEGQSDDTATLTNLEQVVGTPAYIAPEAAQKLTVGPPADIYALGIMLFELAAGRRPFLEDVPVLLCAAHVKEPPPRLVDVMNAPRPLSALIDRMLRKDPKKRPGLEEIVRVLNTVAFGGSRRRDTPTGLRQILPLESGGASWRWLAAGGGLVVLGLVAALLIFGGDDPEPRATPLPPSTTSNAPIVPDPVVEETPPTMEPEAPIGAAVPTTATVVIETVPANATVRWDGERLSGPAVAELGSEHTLVVSARGFRPTRRTVRVDEDTTVRVRLRRSSRMDSMLPAKLREW